MKTKLNSSVKNAIVIGSICSFTYLAVYVVRNVLSAVSPQMLESGVQTNESIGTLSSLFFIVYAIGQLINGIIGDKIKSKYMMSFGVILAGICTITFTFSGISIKLSYVIYGATGFFLSMIYGPMTKLIAENTEPRHATRCSLGYTFSSLLGSPAAGILAAFLVWQGVFCSSGALLIITGILCFIILTRLEKKGIIQYNKFVVSSTLF